MIIEDPRVSDDTPERYRWETWAENLRGGDRFATVSGIWIVEDVVEDGIIDREGGLHEWSEVGPPEDGEPMFDAGSWKELRFEASSWTAEDAQPEGLVFPNLRALLSEREIVMDSGSPFAFEGDNEDGIRFRIAGIFTSDGRVLITEILRGGAV